MSTDIKVIEGSCHNDKKGTFHTEYNTAKVYLTRFYNGEERGSNIQLTVQQNGEYGTSYIHLNKEQVEELGKTLLECFDYDKYPSE